MTVPQVKNKRQESDLSFCKWVPNVSLRGMAVLIKMFLVRMKMIE